MQSARPTEPRPIDREIASALRGLMQLQPQVERALAGRLGVGTTDVAAVDQLVSAPAAPGVVELADRLGIRSASATVLVDRLVAAGHVERSRHPTDRRRVTLHTTESARTEVLTALSPLLTAIGEVTSELDEDTADTVLRFLAEVVDRTRAFTNASPAPPE
ncbi:MarR family transcriptional regulator [Allosaccharopolyspora coralli]|uniref:MarR family transcriptional regulator n=1 Tax=Allosaccharopolyspora coralli TaxID=2665642 RepID=A0A5Q3QB89_9PSEU|nr:MarR family winged helix-turn-helix transcriptional regulator [Allosaccharopolyspora coralli]QGK71828.1 MarR family transcriptional regulator [Allosaccharopolyspora coralli]